MWDPLSGECVRTLEGHTPGVFGVACFALPDGAPRAVSASADKTLRVWTYPEDGMRAVRTEMRAREEALNECAFYFVEASLVRSLEGGLPVFQELRRRGKLTSVVVRFGDVVRAAYRDRYLAVSHRWETPTEPDPKGEQLRALKERLAQMPQVEYVWIDWACMPQGERTADEKADFKRMLPRINMLYLGCSVLLIVDNTYVSRFWTQFEAWLSMRKATPAGLAAAAAGSERYHIVCVHLAQPKFQGAQLKEMWTSVGAEKAHEVLSSPDVSVTNQSDKDSQLPKLRTLDEQVRGAFLRAREAVEAKRAEAGRLRAEAGRLEAEADALEKAMAV